MEIHNIVVDGIVVKGTTKQVVIALRRLPQPRTTREIGELIGITHQGVSHHLADYPELRKRIKKKPTKELSRDLLRTTSDRRIKKLLDISQTRIYKARRIHNIKSPMTSGQKTRRRDNFCRTIFGTEYTADINFDNFLTNLCSELLKSNVLTKREAQIIIGFYKYYKKDTPTLRARRTLIRLKKIKPYLNKLSVNFTKTLVKDKIIKKIK